MENTDCSKKAKPPPITLDDIIAQYPLVISFFSSNIVYLITLLSLHYGNRRTKRTLGRSILYGSISSITSVLLTTPLWVARSRLKCRHEKTRYSPAAGNLFELIQKHNPLLEMLNIGRTEGKAGLWSGCHTSLLLAIVNSVLQSIIYDLLRAKFWPQKEGLSSKLKTILTLLIVSRCSTATITYPLFLVQSKQRLKSANPSEEEKRKRTLRRILNQIITEQGPLGLYSGVETKLWQTTLVTLLFAFTSPKILVHIINHFKLQQFLETKLKLKF